jgi:hypothetical protein
MSTTRVPILWLIGPSGVGKTTLAREIYARLGRTDVVAAHIDTDMLGRCFPPPADPEYQFEHRLKAASLGALWPVYREAGAECLILAGGIEEQRHVPLYIDHIPGGVVTVCRLRLSAEAHMARLVERNGKSLAWADELIAEHEELDRARLDEVVVDTGGLTVADAATLVLAQAGGWPRSA